jgi:hypothetical protein
MVAMQTEATLKDSNIGLDVSKIGQKTENHGECNSWFLMISG